MTTNQNAIVRTSRLPDGPALTEMRKGTPAEQRGAAAAPAVVTTQEARTIRLTGNRALATAAPAQPGAARTPIATALIAARKAAIPPSVAIKASASIDPTPA